jgi:hypothetical protein
MERMDAELLRMPSWFHPAGRTIGITQYLAKYFRCEVLFTLACGFHYRAPPVLIFIAAVGTIFDPKANEFSFRRALQFPSILTM